MFPTYSRGGGEGWVAPRDLAKLCMLLRSFFCGFITLTLLQILNVVIFCQLSLISSDSTYTISGYAYGGGGIALTRVEISLDDGKVIAFC